MILYRSYLHLGSLSRVLVAFPCLPVDTVSIRLVFTMMVQTVKIRGVTVRVPPGAFEGDCTIFTPLVIVTIFSGEGSITVT